jgi:eukaryotic-like serine/threonine-protein kinase
MEQARERANGRREALAALEFVRRQLAAAYDAVGEFAKAEPFHKGALEQAWKQFGPNDPRSAIAMVSVGRNFLEQKKWAAAEAIVRECLAIGERFQPDRWPTFNVRSLLAGSLLGQQKYADAKPLLLSGYDGLKAREAQISARWKPRPAEAGQRVVKLYEALGQP